MTEAEELLANLESDLVERKESLSSTDRVRQAICAFANDLPDHRRPGYVFIGADDDGRVTGLDITDQLLLNLSSMRDSGNILPLPHMVVYKLPIKGHAVAVVEVHPSGSPPVRFDGRTWIRVGPRRALATAEEERRLAEKSVSGVRTWDRKPCIGTTIEDLLTETFRNEYLPSVVSRDVIEENHRELTQQLASMRLFDLRAGCPTNGAILLLGRDPLDFFPGAYIQFVRFDGTDLSSAVQDHRLLTGNLMTQLRQLDELLPLQLHVRRSAAEGLRQGDEPDYPLTALRELILNAVIHRLYDSTNSPTRINWFSDRVEIQNPGGLYGTVNPDNYLRASDYRNPVLAEALKSLGYVERFGVGISRALSSLSGNGNPEPNFYFEPSHVLVIVRSRQ